jgi:anti-sigma regulatory factor (Ser/Thr protein kinase)
MSDGDEIQRKGVVVGQADTDQVEYMHRWWPAKPEELANIRRVVRTWMAPFALGDDAVADLVLAVDEAVANAVEHAYGPDENGTIELMMWTEARALCVEVTDRGRWKSPSQGASMRGRGIQVMHAMTDSVLIHFDARGTKVLMRRAFSASSISDASSPGGLTPVES